MRTSALLSESLAPVRAHSPQSNGMQMARRVMFFQARNVLRSQWLFAYTAFFFVITEGLLRFGGNSTGTVLSLANVVLYVVPLFTLIVGSVYLYNAREFVELLLAQPVNRGALFIGLFGGLTLPLVFSVLIGIAMPLLIRGFASRSEALMTASLIGTAIALTMSCASIALVIAHWCDDRLRGLTAAVGVWMLGAIVYDGLVLGLVAQFGDYPIERPILLLTVLNPIDLARVTLLLQLDVSALMGYTGAVFQQFLGGNTGMFVSGGALLMWILLPLLFGYRLFSRKDF